MISDSGNLMSELEPRVFMENRGRNALGTGKPAQSTW